jgi:hypothetical protein
MYVNMKLVTIETVPGIRGGGDRAVDGVNSSMIYLLYCRNFCKCYNIPPPSTIITKKAADSPLNCPKREAPPFSTQPRIAT